MNSPASCPGTGRPLRPQHRLPDPPSPFNTQSTTRPPAPARSASRVTIRHAMSASGHAYAEPGGEASDDRPAEQAPVVNPAMPVAGAQSLVALLSAGNRQDGRLGADGTDRPPVPGDAVLRLAQDWLRREGHVVNRKRG